MKSRELMAIENAITGNPTITWNKENEKRYDYEGPYPDDKEDIAANAAYILASDGIDLYGFADEDAEGNWLIDIEGNGIYRWYVFIGGRLFTIEDEREF